TWVYTFYNTRSWNTPGGDFVANPSASTPVAGVGNYQWTGGGMVGDVQQWVNDSTMNFGWILTGDETTRPTAKQFDTKENLTPANRPTLTIDFSPPVVQPDLTISKSHTRNFHQGDPADIYTLTVRNVCGLPPHSAHAR